MKKVMSLVLTFALLMSMTATVFAIPTPNTGKVTTSGMSNVASNALGFVQWFGYALAVGMLLYIGIKYMMASANEKADLKKGSISYVIGAVIIFGATGLITIAQNLANEVSN
jgi:TRAP-type C4-dicarboxylate transport system permease small subunit